MEIVSGAEALGSGKDVDGLAAALLELNNPMAAAAAGTINPSPES